MHEGWFFVALLEAQASVRGRAFLLLYLYLGGAVWGPGLSDIRDATSMTYQQICQ